MNEKQFKQLLVRLHGDYHISVDIEYKLNKNNKVVINKEQTLSNCEDHINFLMSVDKYALGKLPISDIETQLNNIRKTKQNE